MSTQTPRILAHRGASGGFPDNSPAAFREAVRLRADGVELDLRVSADGVLMVHHDADISGVGSIATTDYAVLRRALLSNGEEIPTLDQALSLLAGMEVWIELKALPPGHDADLLGVIDRSPTPDRCSVHSFDHRIIARLGAIRADLRRGILSASYPVDPIRPITDSGAQALWQEWHLIDGPLIEAVHRSGAEVIAWTVDDRTVARHLADLGTDALCSNYPDRLRGN